MHAVNNDNLDGGTQILAKPADDPALRARGESCLVLLHPAGPDIGKRTTLAEREYVVGRDTNADFMIPRSSVSRNHSRLSPGADGHWWVEDLGSTNGTFVNEERITRRQLREGDQLRFGDAIFKFLSGENVEAAYHEEIYKMTILDGLTGIHNKRYLVEFLTREMAVAVRHRYPVSIVMFDVDHFKKVNDGVGLGHLAGDAVLKELANRIKTRIRREDAFARYGGEEFTCVLPSTPLEGAIIFAEQLRHIIEERACQWEGKAIPITISLGVATYSGEAAEELEAFVARADERLYAAKRGGRNRVVPSLADVRPGDT